MGCLQLAGSGDIFAAGEGDERGGGNSISSGVKEKNVIFFSSIPSHSCIITLILYLKLILSPSLSFAPLFSIFPAVNR